MGVVSYLTKLENSRILNIVWKKLPYGVWLYMRHYWENSSPSNGNYYQCKTYFRDSQVFQEELVLP